MGIQRPRIEIFSIQSLTPVSILAAGTHTLLTLPVTTTVANQLVKLDSTVNITYTTDSQGTLYTINCVFEFYRNATLLATVDFQRTYQKPDLSTETDSIQPNLTWVDIPPGPGVTNYSMVIRSSGQTNVLSLDAETRAINAIVFPPVI